MVSFVFSWFIVTVGDSCVTEDLFTLSPGSLPLLVFIFHFFALFLLGQIRSRTWQRAFLPVAFGQPLPLSDGIRASQIQTVTTPQLVHLGGAHFPKPACSFPDLSLRLVGADGGSTSVQPYALCMAFLQLPHGGWEPGMWGRKASNPESRGCVVATTGGVFQSPALLFPNVMNKGWPEKQGGERAFYFFPFWSESEMLRKLLLAFRVMFGLLPFPCKWEKLGKYHITYDFLKQESSKE